MLSKFPCVWRRRPRVRRRRQYVLKGGAVVNIEFPYFGGTKVLILTHFREDINNNNKIIFLLFRPNKGRQPCKKIQVNHPFKGG